MEEKCWCGSGENYENCHKSMDEKLKELRKKGAQIPTRAMIKNKEQIKGIREAGRINTLVLDEVAKRIKTGMSTQDIDDIVYNTTLRYKGIPAPLNYEGFPKSVCTSVNDQVCHGIPDEKDILREGDIVNVDCTTIYDGYFGDASRMFTFGEISDVAKRLIKTTQEAVKIAEEHLTPYSHLGDIGYYINRHAKANGFSVVREVGGHGVGLQMHEDPYVCHVGELNTGLVLVPGMIFTIEPMINEGTRKVFCDGGNGWTIYTADRKLSAQVENTVLITEDGFEILSE